MLGRVMVVVQPNARPRGDCVGNVKSNARECVGAGLVVKWYGGVANECTNVACVFGWQCNEPERTPTKADVGFESSKPRRLTGADEDKRRS